MASSAKHSVLHFLRRLGTAPAAADSSDAHLLAAFAAGRDESAFAALVQRHGSMVYGVCARVLGATPDAEDAFQATFLVLARKARSLRDRAALGSFLHGVAYRTALKARTAAARRRVRERQVRTVSETAPPDDEVARRDLRRVLDDELTRLPDKYRTAVVLCYLEGQTQEEAARRLGCPRETIATRLARACDRLRGALGRRGLALPAATLAALLAREAEAAAPARLLSLTLASATAPPPAGAAALAEEVLHTMFTARLKLAAGVLLALALTGITVAALAYPARSGSKPATDTKAKLPKGLDELQGSWKVVGLEEGGRSATAKEMKGMRWVVKGSKLEMINPGKPGMVCEVKVDARKDPRRIDLVAELVAQDGSRKRTTLPGIWKLEKGRLTICLRDEKTFARGYPTEFTAERDSGQAMVTLELPGKPASRPEPKKAPASEQLPGEGVAGITRAPAVLPRYRLRVGQELVYKGESSVNGRKDLRAEWRIWVVRALPKEGWHLVLRSSFVVLRPARQEIVRLACCDLFPDGRLVEAESFDQVSRARTFLPRLPRTPAEAVKGWSANSAQREEAYQYRLIPTSKANRCAVAATGCSDLEASGGLTLMGLVTFDVERGFPEQVELGFRQPGRPAKIERGLLKLVQTKTHDAAWCKAFAADAHRYFAATADYHRVLARQNDPPAARKKALAGAAADLKAALGKIEQPEFRSQLDRLLAGHDRLAEEAVAGAERRAALLGKPAPDWSTTDLEGKPHALKDYRGKVVVLDFWYRGCFWCVRAMPQLKQVVTHFKDRPVAVLGMNTDEKVEDARFIADKLALNYRNLRAAGLPQKYKVQAFPTLVVIDAKGIIRDVRVGYSPTLKEEVVQAVEKALKAGR